MLGEKPSISNEHDCKARKKILTRTPHRNMHPLYLLCIYSEVLKDDVCSSTPRTPAMSARESRISWASAFADPMYFATTSAVSYFDAPFARKRKVSIEFLCFLYSLAAFAAFSSCARALSEASDKLSIAALSRPGRLSLTILISVSQFPRASSSRLAAACNSSISSTRADAKAGSIAAVNPVERATRREHGAACSAATVSEASSAKNPSKKVRIADKYFSQYRPLIGTGSTGPRLEGTVWLNRCKRSLVD
mmetsp:Transcript_18943/g.40883  ORF Transcript_18943/g.40883 Transcript_18943/m.40883 type:complete len:250 (-) Transcript_18943:178-927(-)